MHEFTLEHNGRVYAGMTVTQLAEVGVPLSEIGKAVKVAAKAEITAFAESYRSKLTTSSAGKLAEYRIKEEVARDRENASEAELSLISREAKARGTNRTGLLNDIAAQAAAYRQVALLIGALEAEAGAAITAIADDAADIATQIQTVLGAAKAQAKTAFNEAITLINGGS